MWEDAPLAPAPPEVDVDDWAAACAEVRGECGWHVAPVITETVVVRGSAAGALLLPTLRLLAVTAVTGADSGTVYDVSALQPDRNGWVFGKLADYDANRQAIRYAVTFTHGYATCPDDLLRVVRARLAAIALPAGQFSAGPFGFSSPQSDVSQVQRTIERYTIPDRA